MSPPASSSQGTMPTPKVLRKKPWVFPCRMRLSRRPTSSEPVPRPAEMLSAPKSARVSLRKRSPKVVGSVPSASACAAAPETMAAAWLVPANIHSSIFEGSLGAMVSARMPSG